MAITPWGSYDEYTFIPEDDVCNKGKVSPSVVAILKIASKVNLSP